MGLNMARYGLYWWDCRWKVWVFFLGASLGSLDGLEVGYNEVTELYISNRRVIGTTIGTYYGTEIGLL